MGIHECPICLERGDLDKDFPLGFEPTVTDEVYLNFKTKEGEVVFLVPGELAHMAKYHGRKLPKVFADAVRYGGTAQELQMDQLPGGIIHISYEQSEDDTETLEGGHLDRFGGMVNVARRKKQVLQAKGEELGDLLEMLDL